MAVGKKSARNSWRDATEDVKEAAVEKLEDLTDKVEDGLSSLSKYVKFGSAPEVLLRLRKQFRLQIPIVPDVVVTAGTDVPLQRENDGEAFEGIFNYKQIYVARDGFVVSWGYSPGHAQSHGVLREDVRYGRRATQSEREL